MTLLPHDVPDALLAPVVLRVDARLDEFGAMTGPQLRRKIALLSNIADRTRPQREAALIRAIEHCDVLHGWRLSLDDRGLRLSHGIHAMTLGLPPVVRNFLDGSW